MSVVKTYRNIDEENKNQHFVISRMQDIYDRRQGKTDEPHRHDYYTVLVVEQAKGSHKIDFQTYGLAAQQVHFISPGQVHQVIEQERSMGYVMTFSTDFLIANAIPLALLSDLNLFKNYGQTPPLEPGEGTFHTVLNHTSEIYTLFQHKPNHVYLSIAAYLQLLLITCSNVCTRDSMSNEIEWHKNHVIRQFKAAVDEHYKKEHSSAFYARLLNLSPDHLNRSVKSKLGKTAKEYIQTRITTEAKRLLYFTDLTTKEIGYELGFSEPANFSAFFKKCTQLSPSAFKKAERRV